MISLDQLRAIGLSARAVQGRAKAGKLHRRYRAVYVVGRRTLTLKGEWMAAALACGPKAVLSHGSALALWGAAPRRAGPPHVTTPGHRRGPSEIDVHHSAILVAVDVTRVDGIPCTGVARTLLDYADDAPEDRLRRAVDELERLRVFDRREVDAVLARANGRRGASRLRRVLDAWSEPPFTRSKAERRLHALLEDAGLPQPQFNNWVEGQEVDAYWPARRLVVEVDSYEHHRTRQAFEEDRARDARLGDAGIRVVRVTWRQLEEEQALVKRLQRALG